ncbi:hypothetical protein HUA76_37245 [Myxococcus sp. CA056]|uniref:hypothetical protein n=1 Tax=Myxococcus sp. CA056 TaxID=2741740 RepID=UPI00157B7C1A|nr:hypothetical protein [Myxococcus sp. CA056]NTX16432.1 hypothetical protein [Myxococcus sp. CA056]
MRIDLDTAFLEDGIRSTNFFNGRLLSAEDLSQEQTAHEAALGRHVRAMGEGVAHGLAVSIAPGSTVSSPLVTVTAGLALSRAGHALELLQPVEVSLVRGPSNSGSGATATATGGFETCAPGSSDYVSGTGVYLLVLSPASGREGRAPVSGLGGNPSSGCEAKRRVEGVRFRLLDLKLTAAQLSDEARLRNRVAHLCLGTSDAASRAWMVNPFGPANPPYGLIDKLRPTVLTPCDVPLAVVHWKAGVGLRWVDAWAARRRPARVATPERWGLGLEDRRATEGEASFLQFQEHLDTLRTGTPETVRALDHFVALPAVGLLPLEGMTGARGFTYTKFFDGLTYPPEAPVHVEGSRLQALLRMSLAYPPVDLVRKEPFLWLYLVHENQLAQSDASTPRPQPYLVFASGYLPYLGDARSDAAHWHFGNYALPR